MMSNVNKSIHCIGIHSGERNFVCDETSCNKRFYTKSALVKHIRIHSGERREII